MVPIATDIITSEITGRPSPVPELKENIFRITEVKKPYSHLNMFPEVDPVLGLNAFNR